MQSPGMCHSSTEEVSYVSASLPTLKKQLVRIYEGASEEANSIQEIFELIDPDYAFDSPQKGMSSIGALVVEMLSRRKAAIQQLKRNDSYQPFLKDNVNWKTLAATKKEAWNTLANQFKRSQARLLAFIDQQDEGLFGPDKSRKTDSFRTILTELLHRETRLLGQVEYVHNFFNHRKRPEKGILKYSFRVFPYENLVRQK